MGCKRKNYGGYNDGYVSDEKLVKEMNESIAGLVTSKCPAVRRRGCK